MSGVVVVEGPHVRERLREWLADLPNVTVAEGRGGATRLFGLGVDLEVDTAQAPDVDPTFWAASVVRRAARTVPDAADCASPGLEEAVRGGVWRHPDASSDGAPLSGVLVFKPGTRLSAEVLTDIAGRLAECGYRAESAQVVPSDRIRRLGLAARHHGAFAELARRGPLIDEDRAVLLRLYGTEECVARFGPPEKLPVYTAQEAVTDLGVPIDLLTAWNRDATLRHGFDSPHPDGPSHIGECLFAQVVADPGYNGGGAFVVLNAHMPRVLAEFESSDALAVTITAASRTPLPWPRVRREFCGATDPAKALPGSVRADALAGLLPLNHVSGRPLQRTANGIHLSNGAFETLKDAWVWFQADPETTEAGRHLSASGLDVRRLVDSPFVELEGRRRAVQEVTNGLGARQAAEVLRGTRPYDPALTTGR